MSLPSRVMAEDDTQQEPTPTQQTQPKKGDAIEIPVPEKAAVMGFLRATATTPDPEEWKPSPAPAPQPIECRPCEQTTMHRPYTKLRNRPLGENPVYWFCPACGNNAGTLRGR